MLRSLSFAVLSLFFFSCSRPLFVSHLSPEGIALIKKKGYGMPTHHFFSRFICFDIKCRKKAAWVKSQRKHHFKGYKNPHGLPPIYHDTKKIQADSVLVASAPPSNSQKEHLIESATVKPDSVITLNAILFEKDHYALKKEIFPRLDSVVSFLQKHQEVEIKIYGHTDNVGNESHNLKLSESRAGAVAGYFVNHGVDERRIVFNGYGSSYPVADNTSEDGMRKNRRVEIILHSTE